MPHTWSRGKALERDNQTQSIENSHHLSTMQTWKGISKNMSLNSFQTFQQARSRRACSSFTASWAVIGMICWRVELVSNASLSGIFRTKKTGFRNSILCISFVEQGKIASFFSFRHSPVTRLPLVVVLPDPSNFIQFGDSMDRHFLDCHSSNTWKKLATYQ